MENQNAPANPQTAGKNRVNLIFGVILISFILLFETVGFGILYFAQVKKETCSVMTEGIIIQWSRIKRKQKVSYCPIIEYQVGNELYTGSPNASANIKPFKEGEAVSVGYNPSNPFEFYIEGYDLEITRSLGRIFIVISSAAAVLSIFLAILNRISIDEKKKSCIRLAILVAGILLVYYFIMISLAGLKVTLIISSIMGLAVIYVKLKKRRKDQDGSDA